MIAGRRLLVATTNPGKLQEIRRALHGLSLELLSLSDLPLIREPEETGLTFRENAAIKAEAYATASGLPTVAEDSGLAIDALGGRPGVMSARYPGSTYGEKFHNLYRELAGLPLPWTARFVCSLAFRDEPGALALGHRFAAEGTVEGHIAAQPRGSHGFGYDPVFFYPPYDATLGEVSDERKLAVSHRGAAFRQFRRWLEDSGL
ncbi:MAG: RdgB/HAM1 family non-canonical purine NTP pyrophosphatase [Vicinamibacterales bacterium]